MTGPAMPFALDAMVVGDATGLASRLPDDCIDCVVTSPPYWGLRSYLPTDHADKSAEIGAEPTPDAYVATLVRLFAEVRRALKPGGTCWLNIGDSYNRSDPTGGLQRHGGLAKRAPGLKPKDLVGIPWRVAFALQADGWYLRADIIWHKPNPMPESVTDRPTKGHEYVFLLVKSERYFYDAGAVAEPFADARKGNPGKYNSGLSTPGALAVAGRHDAASLASPWNEDGAISGRNKRSVWTIPGGGYAGSHYATMPPKLVEPCVLAGCPEGGVVLDPFMGSGTVGMVAESLGRRWLGFDIDARNAVLCAERTRQMGLFGRD